jgi:hypothetical protein
VYLFAEGFHSEKLVVIDADILVIIEIWCRYYYFSISYRINFLKNNNFFPIIIFFIYFFYLFFFIYFFLFIFFIYFFYLFFLFIFFYLFFFIYFFLFIFFYLFFFIYFFCKFIIIIYKIHNHGEYRFNSFSTCQCYVLFEYYSQFIIEYNAPKNAMFHSSLLSSNLQGISL